MSEPWPCSTCGAPGVRNLGTQGFCGPHLADLYRMFRPESWGLAGIGLPEGYRPDHGPGYYDLRCSACNAGWVGAMFAACSWCDDARARMIEHQAGLVLEPPDVDPDDCTYDDRMAGWAKRLAVAVDAGIITDTQAERAWRRANRETAA